MKQTVFTKLYGKGGLRVPGIEIFINALKITSLRRYIKINTKSFILVKEIGPFIETVSKFCCEYIPVDFPNEELKEQNPMILNIILANEKCSSTIYEIINMSKLYQTPQINGKLI